MNDQAELRRALLSSGLFDADWYRSRYPDVALSGLDPVDHFILLGLDLGRDPGPDHDELFLEHSTGGFAQIGTTALRERLSGRTVAPRVGRVLQGAAWLAAAGRPDDGLRLARAYLQPRDRNGLSILKANRALRQGDRAGWLAGLNDYLAHFGMAQLTLRPGPTLLDRLTTAPLAPISDDAKVSVIMPAWNAEASVTAAAMSILDQTWRNLELIVVDDASTDGTWAALQAIARRDDRVKLLRNTRNVGPYVAKNLGLTVAQGDWITGQDADDWSHPQRIERHVRALQATGGAVKAGTGLMVRMTPAGHFGSIGRGGPASVDGILRTALISCMFDARVLKDRLGNWDSVRYGADAEMMHRARAALGDGYRDMTIFTMLCLDHKTSLTGTDREDGGPATLSSVRADYLEAAQSWHAGLEASPGQNGFHLPCPLTKRPFEAPGEMVVPAADAAENFDKQEIGDLQAMDPALTNDAEGRPHVAAETVDASAFDAAEHELLQVNRLERDLAEQRARADRLEKENTSMSVRLLAAEKTARDAAEASIRELNEREVLRTRMSQEIAQLTRMVLDHETAAHAKVAQAQKRLKQAQSRVAAMETSLSWRITRPIRAVRRALGRLR